MTELAGTGHEVNQMPGSGDPGPGSSPSQAGDAHRLRERLLARMWAASGQVDWPDEEPVGEHAAPGAVADGPTPEELELAELLDPDSGPPGGTDWWVAMLPEPLLAEYCDAVAERTGPDVFKAGFWDRTSGDGAGFACGGAADRLAPGAVLAGLAADAWADGLQRLTDDELIGILRAGRRLASWSAALELSAAGDLMRRRLAQEAAGDVGAGEHASDEIAACLTLTGRAADRLADLAMALDRLPATRRALASGSIDLPRATVISDEVAGLTDQHAAIVEQVILTDAPSQTTGQLRAATRRIVIAADPAAARQRKEEARREARVERWNEHAGTAALAGRDLPPAEVLAADHHLTALARQLQAAGLPGTLDNLRARAYLALLTGESPSALCSPVTPPAGDSGPAAPGPSRPEPATPAGAGIAGTINLTMPLSTWLGLSQDPGDVAGHGPLDAGDARTLATTLARHSGTRWCLTLTDSHGHPVAHGCARSGPGGPGSGGPGPPGLGPPASPTAGPPGSALTLTWLAGIRTEPLACGVCGHTRESPAYRPPLTLAHLIRVRQRTCSFPGCRRPASRCDLDHTIPFDQGGRTCECDLAPLCRRHHRAKQAHGWRLEQPKPGFLTWTTPSGRTFATTPTRYPG